MSRVEALKLRHGKTLQVLVVARISGCQNQKEISLQDQEAHAKQEIADLYDGSVEYHVVATTGKGERLDRPELAKVEQYILEDSIDVIFMEDVGRMVRGTAAVELWGMAVDRGIRCLAPNDGCDTAETTWEEDLISACKDHVSHCAHTSRRIKKKLMARFKRDGSALPLIIAGYIKPEGAKCYSDLVKNETVAPILKKALEKLEKTENWTSVADYLNGENFPTGPYCKKEDWDGAMAHRFFHNPILKGWPERGKKHSVKQNETGRRISVKNPNGPERRHEPHLAFFAAEELDRVLKKVDDAHSKFGRLTQNSPHTNSRKRTRFPGQCAVCWYCGHQMVWGGNGITKNLMCNGSRNYTCWNSVGFNGHLAAQKVITAITDELRSLQGIEDQFQALVDSHMSLMSRPTGELEQLDRDEAELLRQKDNLKKAILQTGASALLTEWLSELERKEVEISERRRQLERQSQVQPQLPESTDELMNAFVMASNDLAVDSFEMADVLRRIIEGFHVYLVRPLDGGHPVARGLLSISLAGLSPDIWPGSDLEKLLTKRVSFDLFEPSTRMAIREDCVRLTGQNVQQREIAKKLGTHQATVQRALKLDRIMRERKVRDPYIMVRSPDDLPQNRKFIRHLNDKYSFATLEGYVPPCLE